MHRQLVTCASFALAVFSSAAIAQDMSAAIDGGASTNADMGNCRIVEISFQPVPHLQIATWVEDMNGNFIDTLFVTRSTGALGLGNRPGNAMFKSGYRWPYGRRVMVLPVWAHHRNKTYGYITMGGAAGPDEDNSNGYHESYSSPEPFYCTPNSMNLDAVSCASPFNSSKGIYDSTKVSYYPPRADLTNFNQNDAQTAHGYAALNDLAAISAATPVGGAVVDPPIRWSVPQSVSAGQYKIFVELSLEGDFNASNMHPSTPDSRPDLQSYGKDAIGQPSVVYEVPIMLDGTAQIATAGAWSGYGDWDGATGTLHAPDATINTTPGSGAGRLADVTDADGTWRVKAVASACASCMQAPPPTGVSVVAADTSVTLNFTAPTTTGMLDAARSYEIRYSAGTPLTEANFTDGTPADAPTPAAGGVVQSAVISGLKAETVYYVGIRAKSACGAASSAQFVNTKTTKQKFVTLSGCFIATAAYGSAMQPDVVTLRAFRDRTLETSPLGRLAVATYYSLSPPMAHAIAASDVARAVVRNMLSPVVTLARAALLSQHAANAISPRSLLSR